MKTVNTISRWAAFVWLWRHDSEARWFWLWQFLKGHNLREEVACNLRDFGLTKGDGLPLGRNRLRIRFTVSKESVCN
jgi:hypothetical protein